jgi:hypothetical protein
MIDATAYIDDKMKDGVMFSAFKMDSANCSVRLEETCSRYSYQVCSCRTNIRRSEASYGANATSQSTDSKKQVREDQASRD